jgi:hypothetical protein
MALIAQTYEIRLVRCVLYRPLLLFLMDSTIFVPTPKALNNDPTSRDDRLRIQTLYYTAGWTVSPLLNGSTFANTGASTSMKQSAPPPVQERPAPVRGRLLNFVEQRTRMEFLLWLGRAAKMYSHERPSFHIWSSFLSSSVHGILLFFGFNSAWNVQHRRS